jgi:hypothetical protein
VEHDLNSLKASELKLLSEEDLTHIKERWGKRWEMLHSPYHAAGYLLSPAHMDDREAMDVEELAYGFKHVVEKLIPDVNEQLEVMSQMEMFREGQGAWNSPMIR